MSPTRKHATRRRSGAVPLSIVPSLAALITTACGPRHVLDPCDQGTYVPAACDAAINNHGYWYSGVWYPHVYPYASLYYMSRYNTFVAGGGRVRSLSPTTYAPGSGSISRPSVVRGGFGGIGSGHSFAGS